MLFKSKISKSIDLIRKTEKIALKYSEDGYHLAFSGGKDSQVIYELAKMAGVAFRSYFYKTSIDPPELLLFIKNHYPSVIWLKPKMTFHQLILKKGMLPLRQSRFCCEYLKERRGINEVVIIEIRKQESSKRANRKEFTVKCMRKGEKPLLSPILDWTELEVWDFLKSRNIESCVLYNEFKRLGCVGCMMNCKTMRQEYVKWPRHKKAMLKTIRLLREIGKYNDFDDENDVFLWWCSGDSKKAYFEKKKQLSLNL